MIALTQSIFLLTLVCATVIEPQYFFSTDQGGISNYGTLATTAWLYSLGFAAALIGVITLLFNTRHLSNIRLKIVLLVVALSYLLTLISTYDYKESRLIAVIHFYAAVFSFVGSLFMAMYSRSILQDKHARMTEYALLLGFALGALTFLEVITLLMTAQFLIAATTAILLIYIARSTDTMEQV